VEQQLLPWGRVCEVLADLLGIPMSEGTLCSLIEHCAQTLAPVEEQIQVALIAAPVLHQDETGLYVKGSRQWLHVISRAHLTHDAVHAKRGREALEAIGILPQFKGTSVHERWRSYFLDEDCCHANCNVHHLRELVFIDEVYQQHWAADLSTLLLLMKERVQEAKQRGERHLDPLARLALQADYERLLHEGWRTNPTARACWTEQDDAQTPSYRQLVGSTASEPRCGSGLPFQHRRAL
jgi:transposase